MFINKILPDLIGILIVFSIIAMTVFAVSAQNNKEQTNECEAILPIGNINPAEQPKIQTLECLGEFKITAYCSCDICCNHYSKNRPLDKDGNQIVYGAACVELKQGVSIAADTSLFPFGTELIIDGHTYIVQDRGGAIKGKRIDIYFSNHQAACDFGVKYKNVYIEGTNENEQEKKNDSQIHSSYLSCSN